MKRTFSLQIYNRERAILDQYVLLKVTSVSGLGFKQKVTVQESDTVDYVIKQIIAKKTIKLQVHFTEPNSITQAEAFQIWLGTYINLSTYKTALKYSNGISDRLVDVYVEDYELLGLEGGVTTVQLSLKPLSPSYVGASQIVLITETTATKKYPYSYPYAYGGGQFNDNELNNSFIAPIPLVIIFRGKIVNPECSLEDENEVAYSTIRFAGMTLNSGQKLVVDAINQKITFYSSDVAEGVDYFNEIDKTADTFLWAKPGKSYIVPNLDQSEPSHPSLEVTYIQYLV